MIHDWTGKRVTVVGLAREGTAVAQHLVRAGAVVTLTDAKPARALGPMLRTVAHLPVRLVLGGNDPEDGRRADALFLSPGVPLTAPIVIAARAAGVPIVSENLLVVTQSPCPTIGITGSSGKTTVTTLTGAILETAGFTTWVGGNIGRPLVGHLADMQPSHRVVLELSSFQLEIYETSPHIAVVTNLSPDHLDRHPTTDEYYAAKRNIVRHQRRGDVAILNADQPEVEAFAEGLASDVRWFSTRGPVARGAWIADGRLVSNVPDLRAVADAASLRIPGQHNRANALAALLAANAAGADDTAIAAGLAGFGGVPNRLERVGTVGGVGFVNDSIATTPERAIAALRSFSGRIHLIAGGRNKNLDFAPLAEAAKAAGAEVHVFGESGPELRDALLRSGYPPAGVHRDLATAFASAAAGALPGETVLLSPAAASFDQFRDYEERGEAFRRLVHALAERS